MALENRARAGQACGNDLAVFADKVTQGVDVFVVNLNHTSYGEAAKALALEQQRLGIALGALVFVELLERCHDGLSYSVKDSVTGTLWPSEIIEGKLLLEKLECGTRAACWA